MCWLSKNNLNKKQRIINLKPIEVYFNPHGFEEYFDQGYRIDAGYHSYGTIESAKEKRFYWEEAVVKCIIPKGTEYYINDDNEIASSTIIVTDQIVYIYCIKI